MRRVDVRYGSSADGAPFTSGQEAMRSIIPPFVHVVAYACHIRLVGNESAYEEAVGVVSMGMSAFAVGVGQACHEPAGVLSGHGIEHKRYVASEAFFGSFCLEWSYQHIS